MITGTKCSARREDRPIVRPFHAETNAPRLLDRPRRCTAHSGPLQPDQCLMLPRILEPEVMDTAEEAADYDAMDHAEVNRRFVDDFLAVANCPSSGISGQPSATSEGRDDALNDPSTLNPGPWTLLDVGTGTALIPIELASRSLGFRITAIDLAAEMLVLARRNVSHAGFDDVISLERVDAKQLPYKDGTFDTVISNSIVHHIPEPRRVFAEMLRVLKPGGVLFVRDLLRPQTAGELERLVQMYAGNESPRQQQLFRQSLHAALTVGEIGEFLAELGVCEEQVPAVINAARSGDRPEPPVRRGRVWQTSDRHWTVIARN